MHEALYPPTVTLRWREAGFHFPRFCPFSRQVAPPIGLRSFSFELPSPRIDPPICAPASLFAAPPQVTGKMMPLSQTDFSPSQFTSSQNAAADSTTPSKVL
jgi:hypothetical protein